MLNLFYYNFEARPIKPDPNIYYRTTIKNEASGAIMNSNPVYPFGYMGLFYFGSAPTIDKDP